MPEDAITKENKQIFGVSNYNNHKLGLFNNFEKGRYAEDITLSAFPISKKRIYLKGYGDKNGVAVFDKHTFLDFEISNWSYKTCKLLYGKPTVQAKRVLDRFYNKKQVNKIKELIEYYKGRNILEEPIKVVKILVISYPINPKSMEKILDKAINVCIISRDISMHQDHKIHDASHWKSKVLRFIRVLPEYIDNISLYVPIEMEHITWYQDLVPKIAGHQVVYY